MDLQGFDAEEWVRLLGSAGATSIHVTTSNFDGVPFWAGGTHPNPVQELHAACAAKGMGFGIEVAGAGGAVEPVIVGVKEMLEAFPGIEYLVVDGGGLAGRASSESPVATERWGAEFPGLRLFQRTRQGMAWCPPAAAPIKDVRQRVESPGRGRHVVVEIGGASVEQKTVDKIEDAWGSGATCEVSVPAGAGGAPADGADAFLREVGAMVRDRERVDVLRAAVARGGAVHRASNVRGGSARYDAMQVLDPGADTYWSTDDGPAGKNTGDTGPSGTLGRAWIEFQLAESITFDQLVLEEPSALGFRLQEFRLEVWVDGKWLLEFRGTLSGGRFEARVPEVQTRRVRLSIDRSAATPAISRLALFRSPPSVAIDPPGTVSLNPVRVKLAARPGATVRFTVDGSDVDAGSTPYSAPILVTESATIRARAFDGEGGALREATARIRIITADDWHDAVPFVRPPDPGLLVERFEGEWRSLDQMGERLPVSRAVVPGVDAARDVPRPEQAALRYTGHVLVPRDGLYTFSCGSDDGSRLRIHGELVVDNDGLHGMRERSGKVALRAGHHPIEITWFNAGGPATLDVRWSGPSVGRGAVLLPDVLFR